MTVIVLFCLVFNLSLSLHQDTEAKKAKRPHVRSWKLKGDVDKAQAVEKAAKAPSKVSSKASDKASSGSKRRHEVATEGVLVEYKEPPQKRSRADKLGTNVPFTSITKAQKMARVRAAAQTIYTNADDEALLNLGHGEINTLYESWLEVST